MTASAPTFQAGPWTRAERLRLSGIVGTIALMHVVGWSVYLSYAHGPLGAGSFAGAGAIAYGLGMRHAFDADHIAAIDDTTRLMLLRGRRPVGVGFFFAMGHSTVVVALAIVIAVAAGAVSETRLADLQASGAVVAATIAMLFLALVAVLNGIVLRGIVVLWQRMRSGDLDERELELQLLNRGLVNRVLGGRARSLIRSSWHMYPLGILFGLGLETATEVTFLSLTAGTAEGGEVPMLAVLSLPLIFAAGMSAFDTCDSLVMSRAYSWSYRHPARKLYYNIATTAMTVAVAGTIAVVYLASLLSEHAGVTWLAGLGAVGEHFEVLGYVIVGVFVLSWALAAVGWRLGGFEQRYGSAHEEAAA